VCRRIWHKIHATGRGAEPCPDPHHPANPDPYPTRPSPRRPHPGPAPIFDQRPARAQRTVSCPGGTHIIGQRVQVGLR
jgi:hypothetical protein